MKLPYQYLSDYANSAPDSIAIISGTHQVISYRILNEKANQLASYLITEMKLTPGKIVGVCLERTPDYVICLFAIWKAGLIYMPLSEHHDVSELKARLEKAQVNLVITQQSLKSTIAAAAPSLKRLCLNAAEIANSISKQPMADIHVVQKLLDSAYICSSSGTSGNPKLIINSFEGLEGRIHGHAELLKVTAESCVLGFAAFDFDASLMECLLAIYQGATFYIAPANVRKYAYAELPRFFQEAAKIKPITVAILTPSVLRGPLSKGLNPVAFPGLKAIVTMGEECDEKWLLPWFGSAQLFSGYGPTEATIAATLVPLLPNKKIPISQVLPGIILYLVDKEEVIATIEYGQQPTAEKVPCEGEIYLGGEGIGDYLNDAEKSLKRFFNADARFSSKKVYRTGDLACLNEDGLFFRGRIDRQIKRNGKLLILSDIETMLKKCDIVAEAVAISAEQQIIAYIIVKPESDNLQFPKILFKHIAEADTILRPNLCFQISELPINSRGKLGYTIKDFETLKPKLLLAEMDQLCQSEIERGLAKIWWQILLKKEIGDLLMINRDTLPTSANANFFELGGDSLSFTSMIIQVWKQFNSVKSQEETPIEFIEQAYKTPTISAIARLLQSYRPAQCQKLIAGNNPPLFYVKVYHQEQNNLDDLLQINPQSIYKINPWLKANELKENASAVQTQLLLGIRQEQQVGPYHLIGKGMDVALVVALAKQLAMQGEQVFISVFDMVDADGALDSIKANSSITPFNFALAQEDNLKILTHLNFTYIEQLKALIALKLKKHRQKLDQNKKRDFPQLFPSDIMKVIADTAVTVVVGAAGSGKTVLTYTIEQMVRKKGCFTWHLALQGLSQKTCFRDALIEAGFTKEEIAFLTTQPAIFIGDGYSEMARFDFADLWEANFADWPQAKLILTSRNGYLYQGIAHSWEVKSLYIFSLPNFSPAISEDFEYKDLYKVLIEKGLLVTPLAVELVNELFEHKKIAFSVDVNINQLFDLYLKTWLKREEDKFDIEIDINEFLHFISKSYTVNKEGIKLQFQPSRWESKSSALNIDTLILSHAYFPILVSLLKQFSKNELVFPIWLAEYLATYTKNLVMPQSNYSMFFAPLNQPKMANNSEITRKFIQQESPKYYPLPAQLSAIEKNSVRCLGLPHYQYPIFAIHALTGDFPANYKRVAEALNPYQPLYSLFMAPLEQATGDCSPLMKEKADYFIAIIKKIQPKGPYYFLGWSFGTLLAHKIAAILEQNGDKVALILNIDCPSPTEIKNFNPLQRIIPMVETLFVKYQRPYKIQTKLDVKALLKTFEQQSNSPEITQLIEQAFAVIISAAEEAQIPESFIRILQNACINLQAGYAYADEIPHKIQAPMFIAEAKQPTLGINDYEACGRRIQVPARTNWEGWLLTTPIVKEYEGDHFTIFEDKTFITELRKELEKRQKLLPLIPLPNRIDSYLQKIIQSQHQNTIFFTLQGFSAFDKDKTPVDLFQKVENFLLGQPKNLLFLGHAGAGKTTFAAELNKNYAERYKSNKVEWLPIYIKVTTNSDKNIQRALLQAGFIKYEIEQKLLKLKILFIVDGCDEITREENRKLIAQLHSWPQAKTIFLCRKEYLTSDEYQTYFADVNGQLDRVYLLPFSKVQIADYIQLYQRTHKIILPDFLGNSSAEYPGLEELLANPLLLSMACSLFHRANIAQQKDKLFQIQSRTELYEQFIKQHYLQTKIDIQAKMGISPGVNIELAFDNYSKELAYHMFTKGPITADNFNYFNDDRDTFQARRSCLLNQVDDEVQFIHETFLEYYVASHICELIQQKNLTPELKQKIYNKISLLDFLVDKLLPMTNVNQALYELRAEFLIELVNSYMRMDMMTQTKKRWDELKKIAENTTRGRENYPTWYISFLNCYCNFCIANRSDFGTAKEMVAHALKKNKWDKEVTQPMLEELQEIQATLAIENKDYHEAEQLYKGIEDSLLNRQDEEKEDKILNYYNNLYSLYHNWSKYEDAAFYVKKALEVYENNPKLHNSFRGGFLFNSLAKLHREEKNGDDKANPYYDTKKAKEYYQKTIEICSKDLKQAKALRFITWAYHGRAVIYCREKNYPEAKENYDQFVICMNKMFLTEENWPKAYQEHIKGLKEEIEMLSVKTINLTT